MRGQQEALYSAERARRAGAISGIGKSVPGEKGFYTKLGALKGELPKVQFERIRQGLTQPDIDSLFNKVESSALTPFEKVTAQGALAKLLGEGGGVVPQQGELKLLNEIFPPEFIEAVLKNRPMFQKLLSLTEGALNLPRAVMATADFSAPLRQGIFLVGRPKQWMPAFIDQFKYFANPKAYEGLMDNIKARPTYQLMRESKLALTDVGPILGSREEMFMSNLAEKIPGFGKIAAGSNRAYSGFLNKLRADVFDDLVKSTQKQEIKVEGKVLDDIAKFVNSATGRGDLGFLKRAGPILNATFFSPRLMASRLNLLNPKFYADLSPVVRKEALKSLLTFGGTALTVMGLAKLSGAEIGADPRSADFGKIKVGNTRYDVLGGFQQYIKLASQLVSGQIVSSTTGKTITLGEGYKPLTRKDILVRFFESKESPVASFVTALLTGKTGIGEDFRLSREVISRFIPLVAQDMYDLFKERGPAGIGMAIPGVFGVGSQTYGKQEVVTGENQLGQPAAQIKEPGGLAEDISNKLFGKPVIGSTGQYNADAYYKQLKKLPGPEAKQKLLELAKIDSAVAEKVIQALEDDAVGITIEDEMLKSKGVASGDRAMALYKNLKKIKDPNAKKQYLAEMARKKVLTDDVFEQLSQLIAKDNIQNR